MLFPIIYFKGGLKINKSGLNDVCMCQVTRSQPNYRIFWSVAKTAVSSVNKTPNDGITYERMVPHPSNRVPDTCRFCQGALKVFWWLVVAQRSIKKCYLGVSFMLAVS
jgi:hypothetical protein